MNKLTMLLWSLVLFIFTFQFDRITKQYALTHLVERHEINQFLSFELLFNRGVTGGLFHTHSSFWFVLLSLIVTSIALILGVYTYYRWKNTGFILGEVLVLSGAFSNVIDRVLYGGVIDFIAVSWGDWFFPIFNIADVCIVIGVLIIFFVHMQDPIDTSAPSAHQDRQ